MKRYHVCLSIAGSDPSGGAGIQADLKTFSALGCYGAAAVTALTVQSTCGVARVRPVGAELVRQQVDAVLADLRPEAVKIGQLPTAAVVRAVGRALRAHPPRWVVLDPVMVSSSGRRLMAPDAVAALCSDLLPLCSLLTPNRAEAAVLAEHVTLPSPSGAGPALLVTGGDAQGAPCDVLLTAAGRQELRGRRVKTRNDHGTGCTLSSAVAAFLARGCDLPDAVARAKAYVESALEAGAGVEIGQGRGGMNHFFAPETLIIGDF